MRANMGDKVYKTDIPRNVRISEAPSHGLPALVYDLRCPGSQAYIKLAGELIQRERSGRRVTAETRKPDERGIADWAADFPPSLATKRRRCKHEGSGRNARQVPVAFLRPNRFQPRKTFVPEETLHDLANSIREKGMLQPILVRPVDRRCERLRDCRG